MTQESTIKIHAFLASQGIASRRKAEEMVAEGRVLVNDVPATIGQRIDPSVDVVKLDGQPITNQKETLRYFLVNKPIGYISTTSDELGRKNVLDILPAMAERLYPVGRLDMESQGLMLLTNDGDLAYKLTHPKFEVPKTYEVTLDRSMSENAFEHLSRGVRLKDGFAATKHLDYAFPDRQDIIIITITQGRNRQVRRMVERVGYEVTKLVRTDLGPFFLDQLEGKPYLEIFPADIDLNIL
jgi:23S rRNA pseudouridine2605 synthase